MASAMSLLLEAMVKMLVLILLSVIVTAHQIPLQQVAPRKVAVVGMSPRTISMG